MKIATFFVSSSRRIFTKLLSVSESSIKIEFRSHHTLFLILLTPAVTCKERLFYGNNTVQHVQNCQCYNVEQDHYRKPL